MADDDEPGQEVGQELSNPVLPTGLEELDLEDGPEQTGTEVGRELSNPVPKQTGPKPPINMGWSARGNVE